MALHCHAGGGREPARRGRLCEPGRQQPGSADKASAATKRGGTLACRTSRAATSTTSIRRSHTARRRGTSSIRPLSSSSTIRMRAAPRGSRLDSGRCLELHGSRTSGTHVHVHDPPGFPVQNGARVTAANYAYCDQQGARQGSAVAGIPVHLRPQRDEHRRCPGCARRQGQPRPPASKVSGQQADRHADEAGRDLPREDLDAVLPGDADEPAPDNEVINVSDRNQLPSAGPYYVATREPNRLVTIRRNPNYQGSAPARTSTRMQLQGAASTSRPATRGARGVRPTTRRASRRPSTPELSAPLRREPRAGSASRPRTACSYIAHELRANAALPQQPGLRRAVNFAINRTAMVAAVRRRTPASRTTRTCPPGVPGFRRARTSTRHVPNVSRARPLANAARRGRAIRVLLRPDAARPAAHGARAQRTCGRSASTSSPQGYRGFAIYDAAGKRDSPDHACTTGRLVPGLPGSVRLHQRPALRREHPGGEQQQPRVLQQPDVQPRMERRGAS